MNSLEAVNSVHNTAGIVVIQTRVLPDESLRTTVSDNGPGIAADMADRMFNPFQTSKPSGMGMGLSISRSIIEAYGGQLWADMDRSDGALFGFTLPACA
jgi:two-component system sensor kinase FixL